MSHVFKFSDIPEGDRAKIEGLIARTGAGSPEAWFSAHCAFLGWATPAQRIANASDPELMVKLIIKKLEAEVEHMERLKSTVRPSVKLNQSCPGQAPAC